MVSHQLREALLSQQLQNSGLVFIFNLILSQRAGCEVLNSIFPEGQDGEDVERRKRRRKATKRKREGRSLEEEEGSLSCDIKLDESLDRTLEDGAKQHNLTVVNVRNILHVGLGQPTGHQNHQGGTPKQMRERFFWGDLKSPQRNPKISWELTPRNPQEP